MKIWTIFVLTSICGLFVLKGQDMPDEARRYYIRGCTAIEMAKNNDGFEAAAKEFKKVIELAPNFPDTYNKLGEVYEKLEKCPEVIDCYTKYLSFLKDKAKISELKDKIYRLEFKCENIKKRDAILGEWCAMTWYNAAGDQPFQYFNFYLENNTIMVSADTSININVQSNSHLLIWNSRLSFPVTIEAVDKINFSFPVKCTFWVSDEKDDSVIRSDNGNFSFKLRVISDKLMVGIFKVEGFSLFAISNEKCLIFLRTREQFARLSSTFFRYAIPCDGIDTDRIIEYLGLN